MERFRCSAPFMTFLSGKCALTASRVKSDIAEIAQDYAVPVSESDRKRLARVRAITCDTSSLRESGDGFPTIQQTTG
jgi:hypothetical protein